MRRFRLLTLLLLFSSSTLANAQPTGWLPFAPKTVELRGKMLRVLKYGPPGYGENPESDKKYEIPVILLAQPVRMKGDPANAVNKEDLINVSFVQLIFTNMQATEYWRYTERDIVVTGTVFRAETGHHYTDIVMQVKGYVERKDKNSRASDRRDSSHVHRASAW